METLQSVLERRRRDLVEALILGTGFNVRSAERFVTVAGTDLVQALEWRNGRVRKDRLAEPDNVREVLSVMEAHQIAAELGIPPSEVWPALRAFVPRALELADRCLRA